MFCSLGCPHTLLTVIVEARRNLCLTITGIPFAEPPLGNLRLKPPVQKTQLNTHTLDASSYGPGCLQPAADTSEFSEDCLTLNIHRPIGVSPSDKLPVVVPSCAALARSGKLPTASQRSFGLTVDGPHGIVPAQPSRLLYSGRFSRMPFITGTNLDEGTVFVNPEGDLTEAGIRDTLIDRYSPPLVSSAALNATVNHLLKLYPDTLALGSPYNIGNETFGLPAGFKRESAIIGDTVIQAPRRRLTQAASKFGVPVYAYYFTQPQPFGLPYDGVAHTTEIAFVYGVTPDTSPLSKILMDYWLSYGTSLTPNDGRGSNRPTWPQYTARNQVLMQLNSENLTAIPDTYRKAQIDFTNKNPLSFHH